MSGDRRDNRSLRAVESAHEDGTANVRRSEETEDAEVVSLIAPNLAPPVKASVAAGLVPEESAPYSRAEKAEKEVD